MNDGNLGKILEIDLLIGELYLDGKFVSNVEVFWFEEMDGLRYVSNEIIIMEDILNVDV